MKKILIAGCLMLGVSFLNAAVKINESAPDFLLTGVTHKTVSLSQYKGKYVVLEWTNYECPFVKKHYKSNNMQTLQAEYTNKGVIWISINSSAKGKQGNFSKAEWVKQIADHKSAATVVALDENGKVGKLYGAKTTPHIFIINPEGKLIYQGAIDSISSFDADDIAKAENYVKATLDAAMVGKPVAVAETEAYGCSVKY